MKTFKDFLLGGTYALKYKVAGSKGETQVVEPKSFIELKSLVKNSKVPLNNIKIPKGTEFNNFAILFRDTKRPHYKGLETWDVSDVVNFNQMFEDVINFTGKEIEKWDVSSGRSFSQMFEGCDNFDADLSRWNISKLKKQGLYEMFYGCRNFTGKGLDKWKINIEDNAWFTRTFKGCSKFTGKTIEKWNISKVYYMFETFANCSIFDADLSHWDVSNVNEMIAMFEGCKNFTGKGLENWDVSNVENMNLMFAGCKNFTGKGLENWDLSSVKECADIFKDSGVKVIPENFRKKFEKLGLSPTGER